MTDGCVAGGAADIRSVVRARRVSGWPLALGTSESGIGSGVAAGAGDDGEGRWRGDGAGGLHGRGHHEDPGDQTGGGDLEGGEHREVDCLAASGDRNRFCHQSEGELCPGDPRDDRQRVDDDLITDTRLCCLLKGVEGREAGR